MKKAPCINERNGFAGAQPVPCNGSEIIVISKAVDVTGAA